MTPKRTRRNSSLAGRIVNTFFAYLGKSRQAVFVAAVVHNMPDGPTAHDERVSEQLSVAAPGNRFGAHDSDSQSGRDFFDFTNGSSKFIGQHEIGVSAESADSPTFVGRLERRFAKSAQVAAP